MTRVSFPLAALGPALLAAAAAAQAPRVPLGPARITPGGTYRAPESFHPLAVEPVRYGPGYGYGVTYLGWPEVPYFGGVAYGPGLSGLGPYALVPPYPKAREAAIREEIRKAVLAESAAVPAAVAAPGDSAPRPAASAQLRVEFPAQARVWLDGHPLPAEGATWVLTSRPLREGERTKFVVKARWVIAGEPFEWQRTVTLGADEQGRLTVFRGTSAQ